MKLHLDEETDALYFRFDDSAIVESEEVAPGIVLDFDQDEQVVAIEILRFRERFPRSDVRQMHVEVA